MTLREWLVKSLSYPDDRTLIHDLEGRMKQMEGRFTALKGEDRQDYTERLAEKDRRISELRTEIAGLKIECDRMRSVLMPFGSPAGAIYSQKYDAPVKPPVVPAFSGPDDWQAELNRVLKEEEDGLRSRGRQTVNQSSADDGSQSVSLSNAGQV